MRAAVIGEFNPFHSGHALLFRKAREAGAEHIVTLMSGDYVQRGAPAIIGRHARAEAALCGGADVVIAYPTRFAASTAESFAYHAVRMLDASGAVDCLVFGSESGDIGELTRCAQALLDEAGEFHGKMHTGPGAAPSVHGDRETQEAFPVPGGREAQEAGNREYLNAGSQEAFPLHGGREARGAGFREVRGAGFREARGAGFRERLHAGLREGLSFPAARARALPEFETLLSTPNNILAVEYIKAILVTGSSIKPVTFCREGSGYHDPSLSGAYPSASAVRAAAMKGAFSGRVLPGSAAMGIAGCDRDLPGSAAMGVGGCGYMMAENSGGDGSSWDAALKDALPGRSYELLEAEALSGGLMSSDDFSALLLAQLSRAENESDLTSFLEVTPELARTFLKNRDQYHGFLPFADMCRSRSVPLTRVRRALLHIALDLKHLDYAYYLHILGYRRDSASYIREMISTASIPCGIGASSLRCLPDGPAKNLFQEELRISNLYEALQAMKAERTAIRELSRPVIRI